MALFELTDDGIVFPTESELIEHFGARQLATVDGLLETHDQSVAGQLNAIYSTALIEIAEVLVDLVSGLNPDQSSGLLLTAHAALTGIKPEPATYSTVTLTVTGDPGTIIPAGALVAVEGNGDAVFATDAEIELFGAGNYQVTATATEAGPVFAPAGKLTQILGAADGSTVTGWNTATNAADATVGKPAETEEQLRARRVETLASQGGGTLASIAAHVLEVDGVLARKVYENTSDIYDAQGLPPHSFEVLAFGDHLAPDIAKAIWQNKPAGIKTAGTFATTVIDEAGNPQDVYHSAPAPIRAYVFVVVLEVDDDPPSAQDVKDRLALSTVTTTDPGYLEPGVDVLATRLLATVMAMDGILDARVNLSGTPIAAPDVNQVYQTIPITSRQVGTLQTSDIQVQGLS